ncbi:hypothetical protein PybrP1_002844 [[Pythium] brassicae (nom. inval.)]|nr:hypothetical protein PybrP1_002844 [[Pythium] brassicae (nom. inval.)]
MQLRPRVARVALHAGTSAPRARTSASATTSVTATQSRIQSALLALADPQYAMGATRFFKDAYSKGDVFIGVRVPQCRAVVRAHLHDTTRAEVVALLCDARHEMRVAGAICVVEAFAAPLPNARWLSEPTGDSAREQQQLASTAGTIEGGSIPEGDSEELHLQQQQQQVVEFYLEHLACFDNWDLVDISCPKVLGAWMLQRHAAAIEHFCRRVDAAAAHPTAVEGERALLADAMAELPPWYQKLLVSTDFWETRVSVVLLLGVIRHRVDFALHVCRWQLLRLLGGGERAYEQRIKGERFDDYDLVHKACGWVLRECGKRDRAALLAFLARYAPLTPRTTLQYATEHLDRSLAQSLASQGRVTRKRARPRVVVGRGLRTK